MPVYLIFVLKQLIKKGLFISFIMQLNNLVIISIPHPTQNVYPTLDTNCVSPTKPFSNPSRFKDDISWKKSLSAFKKFKCKKDKDNKTPKRPESNLSFLQQQLPNPIINTNFCLVDNDIKFSLLTNPDYELIQFHGHFDYFDPNTAPFFEFGLTYNFPQHQNFTEKTYELQEPLKLNKKASTTPRLRKEYSKKDKSRAQNTDQDIILKRQKSDSQQNAIPAQPQPGSDPFIIIKGAQLRPKQLSQCQCRQQAKKFEQGKQLKKCEQVKKTKSIRKKTKYVSLSDAIYSRDVYSRARSDNDQQEEEQSQQRSIGYGNDELPMIEFDFGMSIAPKQTQGENGFDNLPIYEAKDSSQVRARIRPFIRTTEILQEYQFNPQLVPHERLVHPKEQIQLQNHEALEKA